MQNYLLEMSLEQYHMLFVAGLVLTIFVPGVFHVDMTGCALIGRTPQKFCRLTAIIL
jgi:hypothetical protein